MKTQASKCSKVEIQWLNFWRRNGYRIGRNQPIPCTAKMPPQRRLNRRAIVKALGTVLLGVLIIAGVLGLAMLWLGKAAAVA